MSRAHPRRHDDDAGLGERLGLWLILAGLGLCGFGYWRGERWLVYGCLVLAVGLFIFFLSLRDRRHEPLDGFDLLSLIFDIIFFWKR